MSGVRPASRGRTWNRTLQPGPSGPSAPTHTCGSSFPSSTSGSSIPAGLGKGLEKFWGQQRGLAVSSAGLLPPEGPLVSYLQQQEFLQWLIPLQQKQAGRQGGQQEGTAGIGVSNCGRGGGGGPGLSLTAPLPAPNSTASSYPHDTASSLWCQESWWTGQSAYRSQNQHMFREPSTGKAPTAPWEVSLSPSWLYGWYTRLREVRPARAVRA